MDINKFKEAAELQLSELEMVQSMYPGAKEVSIENYSSVLERQAVCSDNFSAGLEHCAAVGSAINNVSVERAVNATPNNDGSIVSRLDYSIQITDDEGPTATVLVSLPPLYPCSAVAELSLRCARINKTVLATWNLDLQSQLRQQEEGDCVVGVLLAWVTENMTHYTAAASYSDVNTEQSEQSTSKKDIFCRMWVYSHHIYSKVKRKHLLELSVEYDLTGFMLPGKPGIICVEGTAQNTTDWWGLVRSWQWQKILCKRQETEQTSILTSHRRFGKFQELGSGDGIRVKNGGYHVEMGDVYRYLKQHRSEYMFREYFGVEGKDTLGEGN